MYIYTYTYWYIYICMYESLVPRWNGIYVYLCMYTWVCVYIYTYIYMYIYMYIRVYIYTYISLFMCIHARIVRCTQFSTIKTLCTFLFDGYLVKAACCTTATRTLWSTWSCFSGAPRLSARDYSGVWVEVYIYIYNYIHI